MTVCSVLVFWLLWPLLFQATDSNLKDILTAIAKAPQKPNVAQGWVKVVQFSTSRSRGLAVFCQQGGV